MSEGRARVETTRPPVPDRIDRLGREIVDAAFQVHAALGPGLLESAYEHCLAHELTSRDLGFRRQLLMPVRYRDTMLDAGYQLDLLIDGSVIVEIKAVDAILPVHRAQLLTYLRSSGCRLGYLMNFNVKMFRDGLKRPTL